MSKQVSKTVIGAFVLGALVLVVAGVLILGSGAFLSDVYEYVAYFDEPVQGLNKGSPVVFKGVKIGAVTDVSLDVCVDDWSFRSQVLFETHGRITPVGKEASLSEFLALSEAEEEETRSQILTTLVDKGLRARLELQSMVTGQLMVSLDFYAEEGDEPKMAGCAPENIPQLPTVPSKREMFEKLPLDKIVNDLRLALQGIERMINGDELKGTLAALHKTMTDLEALVETFGEKINPLDAKMHAAVDDLRNLMQNINGKIGPVADGLTSTLSDTRRLVSRVDKRVDPLATGLDEMLSDTGTLVRNMNEKLTPLGEEAASILAATRAAIAMARETLATLNESTGKNSTLQYKVVETLESLSDAADSIKVMADYIERHPEALLKGKSGN